MASKEPKLAKKAEPKLKLPAVTTKIKNEFPLGYKMPVANGSSGPPLFRLTPPRDLTLGGRTGPPKKVFTPNLNVVRNKNLKVKTSKDTTQTPRGRGRGRGRGTGERGARRGGASNIIQTAGLFSEGAGAVVARKSYTSSLFSRVAGDSISMMRKPIIVERKMDIKEEKEKLFELLGDSDDEDLKDKAGIELIPLKLTNPWEEPKMELKVPKEDIDAVNTAEAVNGDAASTINMAKKLQDMHVNHYKDESKLPRPASLDWISHPVANISELFDPTEQKLFLVQLPHTLPCNMGEDEETEKTADPATETSQPEILGEKPLEKLYSLKEMEEGQVGKLLRYKSGKMKLVLGETYFDMQLGIDPGFIQNVMSVNANRNERSGNMINLGSLHGKVIVTPDWEYILREKIPPEDA